MVSCTGRKTRCVCVGLFTYLFAFLYVVKTEKSFLYHKAQCAKISYFLCNDYFVEF